MAITRSKRPITEDADWFNRIQQLAEADAHHLARARCSYGNSWHRRGGIGAFMMLARKWDRLERTTEQKGWDIFRAIQTKQRDANDRGNLLEDVRDLRRYLLLVEEYVQQHPADASPGPFDYKPEVQARTAPKRKGRPPR